MNKRIQYFFVKRTLFLLIAVATALLGWFIWKNFSGGKASENRDNGVACTQEAMPCSDGSIVSRTGPNCEFTACPIK